MILRNFRKNKKKSIGAFVFLLLYSLLLFQDVVLNRVFCIKPEGTIDLEFAFMNYKCACPDNGLSCFQRDKLYHFNSEKWCCLDIPLGDSFLGRILPLEQKNFNLIFKSKIDIEEIFFFENQVCQIHHLLPYIRYLQVFPNFKLHSVLLC